MAITEEPDEHVRRLLTQARHHTDPVSHRAVVMELVECSWPEILRASDHIHRRDRYSDDAAADTAGEVVRTLLKLKPGSLPKLDEPNQFWAWIWGVAKGQSFNVRRKRSRSELDSLDANDYELADRASSFESQVDTRLDIVRALKILPPKSRAVVILVDCLNLPYKEAAQELGISVSNLTTRLHRGRKALRELLRRSGY